MKNAPWCGRYDALARTASNLDGIRPNGEREMIHILMEMPAIVRAIWEDRRGNILHHVFNRMSLLSFTEWQGRRWQRTTAIEKSWTKQKTAEKTINWGMTDYSSHPETDSRADTTLNRWRGKNAPENIHIIFATLIQMFFVCRLAWVFLFHISVFFPVFLMQSLKKTDVHIRNHANYLSMIHIKC